MSVWAPRVAVLLPLVDRGRAYSDAETSPPIPVSFPSESWKTYFQT